MEHLRTMAKHNAAQLLKERPFGNPIDIAAGILTAMPHLSAEAKALYEQEFVSAWCSLVCGRKVG